MTVHTFLAPTAAEAVEQIRRQLGPDAVVLNVRRAPASGLARLWQRPAIEVQATVPAPTAQEPASAGPAKASDPVLTALRDLREELAGLKGHLASAPATASRPVVLETAPDSEVEPIERMALDMGLLPVFAHEAAHAWRETKPASEQDCNALRTWLENWLTGQWRSGPGEESAGADTHVFVGPAGSGKSTLLCKWLAQDTLMHGRRTCVWRLDSGQANTAGWLDIYAEILGVPVERRAQSTPPAATRLFIDLPGTDWNNPAAVSELSDRLRTLPSAQVHLVLNGAYDPAILLAQVAGFSKLPCDDLVITHLDETPGCGKIWNLVLGTKLPLRVLSAGQNVPGVFQPASPARLLGGSGKLATP